MALPYTFNTRQCIYNNTIFSENTFELKTSFWYNPFLDISFFLGIRDEQMRSNLKA